MNWNLNYWSDLYVEGAGDYKWMMERFEIQRDGHDANGNDLERTKVIKAIDRLTRDLVYYYEEIDNMKYDDDEEKKVKMYRKPMREEISKFRYAIERRDLHKYHISKEIRELSEKARKHRYQDIKHPEFNEMRKCRLKSSVGIMGSIVLGSIDNVYFILDNHIDEEWKQFECALDPLQLVLGKMWEENRIL